MGEKHEKKCKVLHQLHFLIFISTGCGCVSISAFASLIVVPVVFRSSAVGLKICAITAGTPKSVSLFSRKRGKSTII